MLSEKNSMSKVKGQTSNWENNEINTSTQNKSLIWTTYGDSLQHNNNRSNSPTEEE